MEPLRWKAFLRLRGETSVVHEGEIMDQFDRLVQSFQRAGIDYSLVVLVEGRRHARAHTTRRQETSQGHPIRTRGLGGKW